MALVDSFVERRRPLLAEGKDKRPMAWEFWRASTKVLGPQLGQNRVSLKHHARPISACGRSSLHCYSN